MPAESPVRKSPPLEERTAATMSVEQGTPVREFPDQSTVVTAATTSLQDSPPADGLVPPQRRLPLLLSLVLVLVGFFLVYVSRRI
jgi:hypothetical protein